jgi:hypothetical protein
MNPTIIHLPMMIRIKLQNQRMVWYYPFEETLALRIGVQHLMFSYADGTERDGETTINLQLIFSLGPHKAHPF